MRLARGLLDLVPLGLVVVAEASWVAVVGWLVQEYALRGPVLGIPAMAVFVVVGVVAARTLAHRGERAWPPIALGVVAAGGLIGWLAAPDARAALAGGPFVALAAHPGGWLAALAVLRGFAHSSFPLSEASIGRLLTIGVPGLAVVSLLGGLIQEPFRREFLDLALLGSILFVATATPALAMARLGSAGRQAGFDWRRNPVWAALLIVLVAATLAVALPLSGIAGAVLEVLVAVALIPLLILGFTVGFDQTGKRVLAFTAAAALLFLVLGRVAPNPGAPADPGTGGVPETPAGAGDQVVVIGFGGLLLVLAMAAVLLLAAAWMRRQRPDEDDAVFETRRIDRSVGPAPARRARRGWRPRTVPGDASAAYLALLGDLERHQGLRREPNETPAEHAARLRADGVGAISMDLLAADYALDRFGGVPLVPHEHRRAIERWRTLRRTLVRPRPGPRPSTGQEPVR